MNRTIIKNFAGLALTVILAAPTLHGQILEYRFNTAGAVQSSIGSSSQTITTKDASNVNTDYISASGTGVSGLAGDSALDFSSATWQTTGPRGSSGVILPDLANLTSFTIAGWAKNADSGTGVGRLFYNASTGAGIDLYYTGVSGGNKTLSLGVNGASAVTSAATQYSGFVSADWTFFAVTYDATSGAVQFYSGATTGSLTLSTATFGTNPGTVAESTSNFQIGNVTITAGLNRPFDGWMDNFRVYGSTSGTGGILDSTALTSLRDYDAATVPEPSTWMLLGLGVLAVALVARRRRTAQAE